LLTKPVTLWTAVSRSKSKISPSQPTTTQAATPLDSITTLNTEAIMGQMEILPFFRSWIWNRAHGCTSFSLQMKTLKISQLDSEYTEKALTFGFCLRALLSQIREFHGNNN
jgi:hypothetical protein